MSSANYVSYGILDSSSESWSWHFRDKSNPEAVFVGYVNRYLQLYNEVDLDANQHIKKITVSYQLWALNSAVNTAAYLFISNDRMDGTTYSDVNREAILGLKYNDLISVPYRSPTGDIIFEFDFENESRLSAINKSDKIYLLIATGNISDNVQTSTDPILTASTPGIVFEFADDPPEEYTVSYNTNGGTPIPNSQTKYYDVPLTLASGVTKTEEFVLTPNANGGTLADPTERGSSTRIYEFLYWRASDTQIYSAGGIYDKNESTIMSAIWGYNSSSTDISDVSNPSNIKDELYITVTCNYNNGTSNSKELESYRNKNYPFIGWYTQSIGGSEVGNSTDFSSDSMIYAHWGTGEWIETETYVTLPDESEVTWTDHTLLGYSESSSATEATYQPGEQIRPGRNMTLYAVWESQKIQVTFDPNGGTMPSGFENPHEYSAGEKYGYLPTPTRSGYRFSTWQRYLWDMWWDVDEDIIAPNVDITLVAKWIQQVTVSFYSDGSKYTEQSYDYPGKYNPLPSITKQGYTFDGWYTNENIRVDTSTNIISSDSHNLYAHWTQNISSVTVEFIVDGSTYATRDYSYPGKYNPLPSIPEKSGYTTLGWFTSESGGSQITTSTATENVSLRTFYARYSSTSITVTFNTNGGSVSPTSKTVSYGGTFGELPTPTRSGYNFVGWFTSITGGTKIEYDTIVTYTSNITLYARWVSTYSYNLTFNINGGEGTVPSTITATDISESSYTAIWDLSSVNITTPGWLGWSESSTGSALPGGTSLTNYTLRYDSTIDVNGVVNRTLYAVYDTIVDTNSVRIYDGTKFLKATPYVYYNGRWNKATAYVYNNGWKKGM